MEAALVVAVLPAVARVVVGNMSWTAILRSAIEQGVDESWQSEMSSDALHRPRQRPSKLPGQGQSAAVLMLMFPSADQPTEPSMVFTRRPETLRHHPGQISFPGGRCEEGETPEQTALRETFEEIGVSPEQVEIVGRLNSVYIPPSDFTVTPLIGWVSKRPKFSLQESEVAETIEIPVTYLLDRNNRGLAMVESSRGARDVPCFLFQDRKIWGATAIMLDDLLSRIQSC